MTLRNRRNNPATGIRCHFPVPDGVKYVASEKKGTFGGMVYGLPARA